MSNEGQEKKQKAHGLGRVFSRQHGPRPALGEADTRPVHWWIAFYHNGREFRESAGPKRKNANDLLKKRLGEIGKGGFVPDSEKVTYEDLGALLVNDYQAHGRKTLDSVKRSLKRLGKVFGASRAVDIKRDSVDRYIAGRLQEKAARATIRREVAMLSRAFALAVKAGRLTTRPHFTRLEVENTRTDSFTQGELALVLDVLKRGRPGEDGRVVRAHPDLVAPVVFAAVTGWRMRSDVLTLRWDQVDLPAGTVTRWSRGTSKAGEIIVFPFAAMPELVAVLNRQSEERWRVERKRGTTVGLVFHRDGKPIKDLYGAWRTACRCAGIDARRIQHDLRRTAARNLRTLGMSDRDIAELCGWKTVAMVERYLGRDPAGVADRLRHKVAESAERGRFTDVLALGAVAGEK